MKKIVFVFILISIFCTGCRSQKDTLVICTDYHTYGDVERAVNQWKKTEQNSKKFKTEIVKIPQDETSSEIKITELKTEIMAGEGPDLFIFSSDLPYVSQDTRANQLFQNPEKVMHSNIFLSLNSYLENASHIQVDNCNQNVLKAGQIEGEQFLLPIIYNYYAWISTKPENQQKFSVYGLWQDVRFLSYLGEYADYKKQKLRISEEDLIRQFHDSRLDTVPQEDASFSLVTSQHFLLEQLGNGNGKVHTFGAVKNIDGGVTANISVYAGVNRNTQVPEVAFSLLETFYTSAMESFPSQGIHIEQNDKVQQFNGFENLNYSKLSVASILFFLPIILILGIAYGWVRKQEEYRG